MCPFISPNGISCVCTNNGPGKTRIILNGITGLARPGRMLAIMGPSGSGKSSLLHALAGQTEEGTSGLRLEGELVVNGEPVPDGRIADKANLAFVKQDGGSMMRGADSGLAPFLSSSFSFAICDLSGWPRAPFEALALALSPLLGRRLH